MKKLFMCIMTAIVVTGLLCACNQANSKPSYETLGNEILESTKETETVAATVSQPNNESPKTGYKAGDWRAHEYTSRWLNISFDAGHTFQATDEQMVSVKRYSEALRKNNPYNAFQEMVFGWSDTSIGGEPIALTIQPLNGIIKETRFYADETERSIQKAFDSYKIERKIIETNEEEITFCGEVWLKRYTKTLANGREIENLSFYRIVDDCIIRLTYEAQSNYYNEREFLSCFTALDD